MYDEDGIVASAWDKDKIVFKCRQCKKVLVMGPEDLTDDIVRCPVCMTPMTPEDD